MIRRSRISVRPNFSGTGRTGASATPQDAQPLSQEANDVQAEVNQENTHTAALTNKCVVAPSETTTAAGDTNDQNGEGAISSSAVQRRKRFSIKPKVNPGRTCAAVRTPKSPVKAISESPVQVLDDPTTSSRTENTVPQGLRSPSRRRPSGDSKQPKTQPKPTLPSPTSPAPTALPPDEDPLEQAQLPADRSKKLQRVPGSQTKGVPPKPPDKVPPSLPEKEAIEISERAKTLVSKSTKSGLSLPPPTHSLTRLLNDPADLQRLAKARKLRELLKQEMHKEKKRKKTKTNVKEYNADPAKMTMRDLIYYLPISNPMTSYLEESMQENETVVPPSPAREESPERAQEPEIQPEIPSQREEDDDDDDDLEADEEKDDQMMVPRVKVAEDGSLIIDEESLTVEVLRAKGPNPAEGRDPIFERGSTTTYSSFRKGFYTKPWSSEETDMFFLAISMVGTDFSMIGQLFPHRTRSEIKNKFKKEERENSWRIDKAFKERHKLDIEVFSKLLEKILENRKKKQKKPRSTEPTKKTTKKGNRKTKEKKTKNKLSDVEEEEEEEAEVDMGEEEEEQTKEAPDLEVEGEKENEDVSNEGGERKYKKKKTEESDDEDGKIKTGRKNDQEEACIPEDAEATLPEDHTAVNKSEKTESAGTAKSTTIKPAQLSRGRAPRPLLPLGRKWGKRGPAPSTKPKEGIPDAGQESLDDGASKDQVDKNASPSRPAKKKRLADSDTSSEGEEDAAVQPPKATSYGRIPKPVQHLNYPAKESARSSASETTAGSASTVGSTTSAAKPKSPAKKARSSKTQLAQESKKPKLVTLRASQSEYTDEEDENQREAEEMEEQHNASSANKDSSAPVFVPMGLRSPQPVVSEVEETMEELDILVNVPDVLGITQDALFPDASCEQAQDETGTVESCEHQLDLLVDVIDFLSADHMEVSEEASYNEAAQTLLTIGNLAHLTPSTQTTSTQDHTGGPTINDKDLKEEVISNDAAERKSSAISPMTITSCSLATEASRTDTVEPEIGTKDNGTVSQAGDMPIVTTSDQTYSEQKTVADIEPAPQIESSSHQQNAPQTRRGRFSKVKPKPNLGRASGVTRSRSQPMTSPDRTVEESNTDTRVAQSLPVAEESVSTVADLDPASLTDDMPSTEMKSASQEKAADAGPLQVELDSVTSGLSSSQNQSHCFSKTKPKPNLLQATRNRNTRSQSQPMTSPDRTVEESNTGTRVAQSLPVAEESVSTVADLNTASLTDDMPSTEMKSASQEKAADAGPLQVELDSVTSGQSSSQNQSRFSKTKHKPNLLQATRNTRSQSQPMTSPDRTVEDSNTGTRVVQSLPVAEESVSTVADMDTASLTDDMPSTEMKSASQEKAADAGPVLQVELDSVTSGPSSLQNQSRFSKTKHKPNLLQTTRNTRSQSQPMTSPDRTVEESNTDTRVAQSIPVTEESVSLSTVADLDPASLTDDMLSTEMKSASQEKAADAGPLLQVELDSVASGLSSSQNQSHCFSKTKPKPNLLQATRNRNTRSQSEPMTSPDRTVEDSNTDTRVVQSLPVAEESLSTVADLDPASLTDDMPSTEMKSASQEKAADAGPLQVELDSVASGLSSSQNQSHCFSKTKPKPNLLQATRKRNTRSRSQPMTSPDRTVEESNTDTRVAQSLPVAEESVSTVADLDPASLTDDMPSTEMKSASQEKAADAGPLLQVDLDSVASGLSSSQNQSHCFSKTKHKPNLLQATRNRNTRSRSQPMTSPDRTVEESNTGTRVAQSLPVTEESVSLSTVADMDTASLTDDMPSTEMKSASQEKAADAGPLLQVELDSVTSGLSSSQNQSHCFSKTKPKPNLLQATRNRNTRSQSQPMTSPDRTVEESNTDTRVAQSLPVAEESVSTVADLDTASLTDDMPSTEMKSASQEKAADAGPLLQVELDSMTGQSSLQNQSHCFSKTKPNLLQATRNTRSKPQSTDETGTSLVRTSESSCTTPRTCLADTESQVQGSVTTDSVPVQEGNGNPAAAITEELSATQEEESKVESVSQTRKRQFSKVKPKPNLRQTLRTAQSKHQTREDTVTHVEPMKGPVSNLKSTENTVAELEPQPSCSTTPHAKPSLSTGPASVLIHSSEMGSTLASTEEFCSSEELKTEAGQTSSECSEQNVPQKRRRFPKVKPNVGPSIRTTQSTDVDKVSKQDHMDSSSNASSEEQPIKDNSTHADLETTEKASKHLTPPHCSLKTELSTSTNAGATESLFEEIQIRPVDGVGTWLTADSFMVEFLYDKSTIEGEPTQDTAASQVKGAEAVSASQGELSIPQEIPLPTEEINSETMTTDSGNAWHIENPFIMIDSGSSEMSTMDTTPTVEPTVEPTTSQDKVEDGSAPQRGGDLISSTKTTQSNPQLTEDTTTISKPQSSEDCSTQSNVTSTTAHSKAEPEESTHQQCSESSDLIHMDDSEVKGQAAFQKGLSGNRDSHQTMDNVQAVQCDDYNQSEPTDSAQSSKKAPQTRRARMSKPNLGRSRRPPHRRPVQEATQPEPDSGTCSEALEDSAAQRPDSKPSSDIQEPVEGASVEYSHHDNSPNAVSPLDCMTQVPGNSTQDTAAPSPGGTQSFPSHTTLPDEEPFFILSLTEIPVFPSGHELGCVSEPLPDLPVTDAAIQLQSSVLATHGGGVAVGADGAPCNVLVPMPIEEGGESGFTGIKDVEPGPSVCTSSTEKQSVDPHENPKTQPSELPEAVENSEDIDVPSKKRRRTDTGRRAQRQVEPICSEASRALTKTTSESELPCPPVQLETVGATAGAGDKDFTEPQKGTVGGLDVDTADSGSGTQTEQPPMTIALKRPGRKPRGFLSFLSEKSSTGGPGGPQPAKAVSQVPKVKPPHTRRKRAAPAPTTSRTTPLDDSPAPSTALPPEATHLRSTSTILQAEVALTRISDVSPEPSSSWSTAEVPDTQESDCMESSIIDEEPTNVSQYFLSDIFTEVDEG